MYSNGNGGMSIERQVVSTERHTVINQPRVPQGVV